MATANSLVARLAIGSTGHPRPVTALEDADEAAAAGFAEDEEWLMAQISARHSDSERRSPEGPPAPDRATSDQRQYYSARLPGTNSVLHSG